MNQRWTQLHVLGVAAAMAATLTFCRQAVDEEFTDDAWHEEVDDAASPLLKGQRGAVNGDYNYCDGVNLCINGEGDCDANSECSAGAVCGKDNGAAFGMPKTWDVCVAPHCTNRTQDVDETGPDCGGADCGTCAGTCGGTNGDADFCVTGCACSQGQGDCDYDSDCNTGLFCKRKVGASFGLPANVDVCIPNHCKNNVQDVDEVRVDCGGSCQACVPKRAFLTSLGYRGADVGGLAGADAKCATDAAAAGLPGVYRAWLSDGVSSPSTRFTRSTIPYARVDGTVIANNYDDLVDGTLAAPLNQTAAGATLTVPAWTGTTVAGASSANNCAGWTSLAGNGDNGFTAATDVGWTQGTTVCANFAVLMCFQQ